MRQQYLHYIYIILLSCFSSIIYPAHASNVPSNELTLKSWPEKLSCDCITVQAYGYTVDIKNSIKRIGVFPFGVVVTLKNKNLTISLPHDSLLASNKELLNTSNWIEYHELLSKKSTDTKIEKLRKALNITNSNYYRYENKKYIAFFIDRSILEKSPTNGFSELMIIPKTGNSNKRDNNSAKKVLMVNGKYTREDAELILSNLSTL